MIEPVQELCITNDCEWRIIAACLAGMIAAHLCNWWGDVCDKWKASMKKDKANDD